VKNERKSIVSSRSFGRKITKISELKEAVSSFTARAARKLRQDKLKARFLVVFITSDSSSSASAHLPLASSYTPDLTSHANDLIEEIFQQGRAYKRAGVMLGELVHENQMQYDLFTSDAQSDRKKALMRSLDQINKQFESPMLSFASEGLTKKWQGLRVHRSPHYTTSWDELPRC